MLNYKTKVNPQYLYHKKKSFDKLLEECEFTDIYRYKYPDKSDVYSY